MGGKAQCVQFIIEHRPGIKILQMRPVVGPITRREYRNIQSYLPYMTNCVWVYSILGSKTRESTPKSTARNTRARRMAKSLKIKDKNAVDTESYELKNALIDESRTAGDTGILGRLVPRLLVHI